MGLVKVMDIDTGAENKIEVEVRFPKVIYRNSDTRALDEEYKECLASKSSPIPLGSCFYEGEFILPLLANCARTVGFYFGVEVSDFGEERQEYLDKCEREKTIRRIQYKGKDLVIPTDFK